MAAIDAHKVESSIQRYFAMLRNTGYVSITDTRRLLIYMFLHEWLNSEIGFFVTGRDYKRIGDIVRSISGDCLIPYTSYCRNGFASTKLGSPMLMGTSVFNRLRNTQSEDRRHAEDNPYRLVEGQMTLNDRND